MRLLGVVREAFPRLELSLHFPTGAQLIEFVLDTGFEGELALPARYTHRLGRPVGTRGWQLADGGIDQYPLYAAEIDWVDGRRLTTIVELEGNPLTGVELLTGFHIQIELQESGEVIIEPL